MADTFESIPVITIHAWLDADGWHRDVTYHDRPPGTDGPGGKPRGLVRIVVDEWDVT